MQYLNIMEVLQGIQKVRQVNHALTILNDNNESFFSYLTEIKSITNGGVIHPIKIKKLTIE